MISDRVQTAVLYILAVLVFYPGYCGLTHELHGADIGTMHIPYFSFLYRSDALIPFWNPYSHCGSPAMANIAYAMYYPFTWLANWIEPITMSHLYALMHLILLVYAVDYWLSSFFDCRTMCKIGSLLLLGGLATGSLMAYGHQTVMVSYTGGFLAFGVIVRWLRESPWSLKRFLSLVLIYSLMLLGGHPQFFYHLQIALSLFVLFYYVTYKKIPIIRYIFSHMMILLLTVGICWVQLASTFELSQFSARGEGLTEAGFAGEGNLSPATLFKFIFPFHFGAPSNFWGQFDFWFGQYYFGLLGIMGFLAVPMLKIFKSRHSPVFENEVSEQPWKALLWTSLCLFLFGLGNQTPVYHLYQALPMADGFRLPFRYIYLLAVTLLPFLVGGLWRATQPKGGRVMPIILSSLLVLWGLMQTLGQGVLSKLYSVVMSEHVLDRFRSVGQIESRWIWFVLGCDILMLWTFIVFRRSDKSHLKYVLGAVLLLSASLFIIKIHRGSLFEHQFREVESLEAQKSRMAYQTTQSLHNIHLLYGLCSPGGYDSLSIFRYKKLLDTIVAQDWSKHTRDQIYNLENPLWESLNLKMVLSDPKALLNDPITGKELPGLDRYYLTQHFQWDGRKESQYSSEIYNQQQMLAKKFEMPMVPQEERQKGTVEMIEYGPDRVVLKVNCLEPSMLASSENHFPGWTVKVDDKASEIHLWLGTFRSVWLEKGRHSIVFEFKPSHFEMNVIISLSGILVFMILLSFHLKKNKKVKLA